MRRFGLLTVCLLWTVLLWARTDRPADEPKYRYPLLNGLTVGVDLYNPVANLFGQQYGNYEASLEVNLHNRFLPVWEVGVGRAHNTPEDMNFTYVCRPALFNRIGLNYNIRYNSEALDGFYIGLRYGFSAFRYDVTDIRLESPYWNPGEPVVASLADQHSRAHWAEGLAGIRVRIYKNLMMGWSVRYKWKIKVKDNFQSSPWFIPGYGNSGSPVSFTYSVYYRIPLLSKPGGQGAASGKWLRRKAAGAAQEEKER